MSFYKSESGRPIDGSPENSFVGDFTPIPEGTQAVALIKSFNLKEGGEFEPCYQLTWKLLDGDFKDREVRQTIKAFDADDKKKDRALNMMVRIFNLSDYKPTHNNAPTDMDLLPMQGKVCGIKIAEWANEGSTGNWVREVHKADAFFVTKTGEYSHKPTTPLSTKTPKNDFDPFDDL